MHSTVMIDGQLVPPERALVSVFDRGFLYGDSVFEALRTHHGRLSLLDSHLARLERSAAQVLIPLPVKLATGDHDRPSTSLSSKDHCTLFPPRPLYSGGEGRGEGLKRS